MLRSALAVTLLVACSSSDRPAPTTRSPSPLVDAAPAAAVPAVADAGVVPAAVDDVVLITDPVALAEIDAGTDLRARVDGWDDVAAVLTRDIKKVTKAGVGVAGNDHRLFDVRWLAGGHFDLIGVANRIDRAAIAGGCGDFRLVYRLRTERSRLPMTVNLIYPVADDAAACAQAAAGWRPPAGLDPVAQSRWLLGDGALADLGAPAAVQVNLQQVRWPSAVRPDLGYASTVTN